jgi:hypothetical protein
MARLSFAFRPSWPVIAEAQWRIQCFGDALRLKRCSADAPPIISRFKKLQTVFFLAMMMLLFQGSAGAQKFEVGFTAGYSTFSMKSMSEGLEYYREALPFDAVIMADYPSWISFGGYALVVFPFGYSVGPEYTFNSTGGRISSADYSGSYQFNQTLTGHTIGVLNGYRFLRLGKFETAVRFSLGALLSVIRNEDIFDLANYQETITEKSKAVSFYATPSLQASWTFSFIRAGLFFGYLFDTRGSFDSPDATGKEQSIDWSGIRAGITVALLPGTAAGAKK